MRAVHNWIDGKFVSGEGEELSLDSPLDGSVIGSVRFASLSQLDRAVESAALAQETWAKKTLRNRAQVFYRYRALLQQHKNELAALCHQENGKSVAEAAAGVDRAQSELRRRDPEDGSQGPDWPRYSRAGCAAGDGPGSARRVSA